MIKACVATLAIPIFSRCSDSNANNSKPLIPCSFKIAASSIDKPSTPLIHSVMSDDFQSLTLFSLQSFSDAHNGSSKCFARTESFIMLNVERLVSNVFPLTLKVIISSVGSTLVEEKCSTKAFSFSNANNSFCNSSLADAVAFCSCRKASFKPSGNSSKAILLQSSSVSLSELTLVVDLCDASFRPFTLCTSISNTRKDVCPVKTRSV
mmetsp:Transcript_6089/g.9339  ORF Transcript_6089/g.9339 Transcript_6089/m.9339 type:complete len:208 (+) Transcript_6089:418-1041(+)